MMSVTTPDSLLLGGPDTRPEVAVESITIVHEGIQRVHQGPTVNVNELTVTKTTDCASTNLFR